MSGDEALTDEISIPRGAEIASVKLIVWDGTDTMKPLADPVQVL